MGRDAFSSRLHEEPDRAGLEYYRIPNFEKKLDHFWDPLLVLNRAQVIMLDEVGILDADEASAMLSVLDDLDREGGPDPDVFEEYAGPYLYLESRVIEELGEAVGGKLHTGRSRNDLYSAAIRVAVREALLGVVDALLDLRRAVLDWAEETTEAVMPAFTHTQPAQPITLAHYLLGFDHLLERDGERLRRAYEATNESPLGAAAIGGTGFGIDRERLAELAGFSAPVYNTYDAIGSVDYLPESTAALALLMTNVSRVSQDFLVWGMYETGYVELSESLASVSSIMPQKKNPGVLETTRAYASDAIGTANSTLVHLKAVPYGDVGETADAGFPVLEAAPEAIRLLRLFTAIVDDLEADEDRMEEVAGSSFSTMTEVADTLVRECGLSFRQAHEVVGTMVHAVIEEGRTATEITPDDLDAASEAVLGEPVGLPDAALRGALDPHENVNRRDVVGGTAPRRNVEDLSRQRETLEAQSGWLDDARAALDEAADERTR